MIIALHLGVVLDRPWPALLLNIANLLPNPCLRV